mgnify:FL=1
MINIRKFDFPEIIVCEPTVKGHVAYMVKGKDRLGDFEVIRRYSQFAGFREILITRLMGLYIPPMPPKKKLVSIIMLNNLFFQNLGK